MDPMKPGLTRTDNSPWPGAYLRPEPWLSGGGGLVSTLPDMVALVRSLLPGGPTLLKPETIAADDDQSTARRGLDAFCRSRESWSARATGWRAP